MWMKTQGRWRRVVDWQLPPMTEEEKQDLEAHVEKLMREAERLDVWKEEDAGSAGA